MKDRRLSLVSMFLHSMMLDIESKIMFGQSAKVGANFGRELDDEEIADLAGALDDIEESFAQHAAVFRQALEIDTITRGGGG